MWALRGRKWPIILGFPWGRPVTRSSHPSFFENSAANCHLPLSGWFSCLICFLRSRRFLPSLPPPSRPAWAFPPAPLSLCSCSCVHLSLLSHLDLLPIPPASSVEDSHPSASRGRRRPSLGPSHLGGGVRLPALPPQSCWEYCSLANQFYNLKYKWPRPPGYRRMTIHYPKGRKSCFHSKTTHKSSSLSNIELNPRKLPFFFFFRLKIIQMLNTNRTENLIACKSVYEKTLLLAA